MEKETKKIGGITFTGDITIHGAMFDIHDNQHVHIYHGGKEQEADYEELDDDTEQAEIDGTGLVDKLKPLFYNNEDDVRQFLKEIDGMKDNDITDLVNKWVKAKRISDYGNSRKGVLWGILHQAGLYKRTVQNWNRRVD
jgi:hypothetical protein